MILNKSLQGIEGIHSHVMPFASVFVPAQAQALPVGSKGRSIVTRLKTMPVEQARLEAALGLHGTSMCCDVSVHDLCPSFTSPILLQELMCRLLTSSRRCLTL